MPDPASASESPAGGAGYRGRLAPSPTGYLHLGHARTFWVAWRRARTAAGQLVLFRALGLGPPRYFHCPLLRDAHHLRLAKRHDSLSLRALRDPGHPRPRLGGKICTRD